MADQGFPPTKVEIYLENGKIITITGIDECEIIERIKLDQCNTIQEFSLSISLHATSSWSQLSQK